MPASWSAAKSTPAGGKSARPKPRGSAITKVRPDDVRKLSVATYKYLPSDDQWTGFPPYLVSAAAGVATFAWRRSARCRSEAWTSSMSSGAKCIGRISISR